MASSAPDRDDVRLKRRIILAIGVLVLVVTVFGVLYYRDRYTTPAGVVDTPGPIEQLEKQVKDKPQDVDARLTLAENYLMSKRYADAITQAQEVVKAYPDKDRALLILGVAESMDGRPAAAVEPLEKFVGIHEKGTAANMDTSLEAALYFLADSYIKLDRSGEAVKPLKRALEINPTDADALYKLGVAQAASGKHEEALKAFQKATALVPDFKEAYQGMAASYQAGGDADLAAYANAMVAYASGDYESARDTLEGVLAEKKDFVPVALGLGLVYEQLGELEKAKDVLKHAVQLEPGNVAVKQALGRVNAAMQQ